jgi:predicted Fe-S protein YdhL (DUF1289 family)
MTDSKSKVPSPCIRNCCLNEKDICLGCFRSLEEICGWTQTDDQGRLTILGNAEQRRLQASHHKQTDAD